MECAFVVVLILPLPLLWLAAHAILYPTVVAAQKIQGPFRFQLMDFVALVLQIQLVLGATVAFASETQFAAQRNILLTFGLGATVALWLGSVRFLSKAGITRGLRRMIFILVYLPGTLAVIIVGPLALLALIFAIGEWVRFSVRISVAWILSLGVMVAAAVAGFGLRKLGEWLVQQELKSAGQTSSSSS